MCNINPFGQGLLFQMLDKDKDKSSSGGSNRPRGGYNNVSDSFSAGIGRNPSNNPKSLNNGLGSQMASENAGNAFNAPQKRKGLV